MKNSKLLLLLAGITVFSTLVGCDKGETSTPSVSDQISSEETHSSEEVDSSEQQSQNTFGEGITEKEQEILAKISTGDFTKVTFEATDVLKVKFEVRTNGELQEIIYKGHATTEFLANGFDVYVGVNVKTLKITKIQTEGTLTTHGQDGKFDSNDLGMEGTDGSSFDNVTGSTVSATAINKVAKEVVKAVKNEIEKPEKPEIPERESYTVAFDLNGGHGAFGPVKVEAEDLFTRPANDPTKQDYNFIGWYVKGTDDKYDFTAPVVSDLFLEARWQSAYTFFNGVILDAPKVSKDGKVVIPSEIEGETVTELNEHLYEDNTSLTEIVIPASVKVIGFNCFKGCTSLKKVSIYQTLDPEGNVLQDLEIRLRSFEGCTALSEFIVPARTSAISYSAFEGCTGLTKVTFQGTVEIPETLFKDCTSLKEVVLSNQATKIRKQAFLNCSSLTKVTNSESITEIGENAFGGCTSLKELNLGKNFKYTMNCFGGCDNLSKVTIDPENEKYTIANNVICEAKNGQASRILYFLDTSIETFEFPATVNSYDYHAFDNLTNLKSYTVAEGNTSFVAKNGLIFAGDLLKLVPQGFVGNIELADNERFTTSGVPFAGVKGLKDIIVSENNKSFQLIDGVLYTKGYSKSLVYVNKSTKGVIKTDAGTICEYALFGHQEITDLVLTYSGYSPVSLKAHALDGVNENLKVWVPDGKYNNYTNGWSAWDEEFRHFIQKEAYVEPQA